MPQIGIIMNTKKLLPFIGFCLLTASCTGAIVPINPDVHYLSGKWRQIAGPGTSRIALNIESDKSEIYLDCVQSDGTILRAGNPFPIQLALDHHKVQLNEGVALHTQGASDECNTALLSGTYEAHELRGQKMHLVKTDDWTFVGVFERTAATELDRNEKATVVRSRIEKLN